MHARAERSFRVVACMHASSKLLPTVVDCMHGISFVLICLQDGETPLFAAAWNGHLQTVQFLHDKGARVEVLNTRGENVLFWAARNGFPETVKFLLDKGASVDVRTERGLSPLYAAALSGHKETVNLLVQKGAKVESQLFDQRGKFRPNPLLAAAWKQNVEIVRFLLQSLSEMTDARLLSALLKAVESPEEKGRSLYEAVVNEWIDGIKLLVLLGTKEATCPSLRAFVLGRHCLLRRAVLNGDVETIELLEVLRGRTETGAQAKSIWADCRAFGLTDSGLSGILQFAIESGCLKIAKYLLERGACDESPHKALLAAACSGRLEAVKLLVDWGAKLEPVNRKELSAPFLAASFGHLETVRFLIEKGANVNAVTKNGESALCSAARKGFLEIVKLLCEKGARTDVRNKDGLIPLTVADREGHLEVVDYLFDRYVG
mmetsp:Transcript_34985/g.69056  ORF Transcript_34985/g.69056 Transcript_34985/m.69056 type:complete len:433 (+) Transcript_34985:874-2172(+)